MTNKTEQNIYEVVFGSETIIEYAYNVNEAIILAQARRIRQELPYVPDRVYQINKHFSPQKTLVWEVKQISIQADTEQTLNCMCCGELLRFHRFAGEEEIFVSYYEFVDFNNKKGWLWNMRNRIKKGIRFILGKEVMFAEIILDKGNQTKLRNWLNGLEKINNLP